MHIKSNWTKFHRQFILVPNNKLHGFLFEIISLKSHPSLPRFYQPVKGFFRDAFLLHGILSKSPPPIMITFSLEKRKNYTLEIRGIGKLFHYGNVSLWQELPDDLHIQTHYFLDMPRSLEIIFLTLSFFLSSWLVIIKTVEKTIATNYLLYLLTDTHLTSRNNKLLEYSCT